MRLLLALLVLLAVPASAAAAPALGVYSEEGSYISYGAQRTLGFDSVRRPFNWRLIEPARGHYSWDGYDAIVAESANWGMRMFPFLVDAPAWAVDQPSGETGMRPPRDPADFSRFAAAAVRRWGPDGTFWKQNPSVPYRPIRAWQVWNEPNLPAFWRPEPDARAYLRLLRPAAKAIHEVDPGATVVSAGLPESQGGVPQTEYLEQEYAAGLNGVADAVAVHAYAPDALGVVALVSGARRAMTAHGDTSPLWVTEFGWATAGEPSLFTTDESGQAKRLRDALYALRVLAAPLNLGGIFVFRWQDPSERTLPIDIWPYHSGFVRTNGYPKPGFDAVRKALAAPLPSPYSIPTAPGRLRLRVRKAGRRAVRVRCSRACLASLVLIARVPRPGRAPLQQVRAQRSLQLKRGRVRRVRLATLAGRTLTVSAVTGDGAARRISRSYRR